jgi:hypothetical protein
MMSINESSIELNVQEVGILLSALKELEFSDEIRIAKEYGSVSVLYDKLYETYQQMDHNEIILCYEPTTIEPSF